MMPSHIPHPNPLKLDPTRTTMLRRDFMADMRRRFKALERAIQHLVVVENAFGIFPGERPLPFGVQGEPGRVVPGPSLDDVLTANTRWQFQTDANKLLLYQQWLTEQVDAGILEVSGGLGSEPWVAPYLESSYQKGLLRAYTDTRAASIALDAGLDFAAGGKAQFLRDALAGPVMTSKLQMLQTRAFAALEGVTAAMAADMARTLSNSLAAGHGARRIAKDLRTNVSDLSKRRAMTIARTEIVHAHNEGQLDSFEQMGVEEVDVMAEWLTAHDTKVCPLCRPLEGIVITIAQARGMLPRHPN